MAAAPGAGTSGAGSGEPAAAARHDPLEHDPWLDPPYGLPDATRRRLERLGTEVGGRRLRNVCIAAFIAAVAAFVWLGTRPARAGPSSARASGAVSPAPAIIADRAFLAGSIRSASSKSRK
ncbi:MAG: hypothetical protein ACYDH5_03390 [Acidimicrobiales bacterium]